MLRALVSYMLRGGWVHVCCAAASAAAVAAVTLAVLLQC